MNNYELNYNEKKYLLNENNCSGLINDEEKPVKGIDINNIINILNDSDKVDFDTEYYQEGVSRMFSRC